MGRQDQWRESFGVLKQQKRDEVDVLTLELERELHDSIRGTEREKTRQRNKYHDGGNGYMYSAAPTGEASGAS